MKSTSVYSKLKHTFWGGIGLGISILLMIVLAVTNAEYYTPYVDTLLVLIGIAATIYSYFVFHQYGYNHSFGKVWINLTLGVFLLMIGDAVWEWYEVVLETDPFPSLADVFYLLSYLPFFIGMGKRIKDTKLKPEKQKVIIYAIIWVLITTFIVRETVSMIIEESETTFELLISLSYPLLDLILIALAFWLAALYAGGKLENGWKLVALYNIIYALADIIYSYEDWVGLYSEATWNISDFFYVLAAALSVLAATYFVDLLKNPQQ